jgi:hypothetical protein
MTTKQLNEFAKIELFIRHVRNLAPIGPLRAEGVQASVDFENALGDDYQKIFKTKTWKELMR